MGTKTIMTPEKLKRLDQWTKEYRQFRRIYSYKAIARELGITPNHATVVSNKLENGLLQVPIVSIGFERQPYRCRPVHKGEKHPMHKLTNEMVEQIYQTRNKEKQKDVAARFGVHQSQVSRIWNRKLWKSVGV